jgi:hypothetical protein
MSAFSSTFETSIELHNISMPEGVEINKNPEYDSYEYGILKISAEKTSITTRPIFFRFTTDCSGSMSDKCKDDRTKMDHIQHTMCNMIRFFAESDDATIYIQVHAFDDKIHEIIPTTRVSKDNVASLIVAVGKMYPMQSTNIELALTDAAECIEKHLIENPGHSVSHIFLTDGDATAGNQNADYLVSLVKENTSNIFVAFGLQHSARIMQKLGSANQNSSNWLIDNLENAGLVYGEILNNELFKVLEKVEVTMVGGVIYDYKKGEFVDKLYLGDLVTETKKTYHILVKDGNISADISGVKYITTSEVIRFTKKGDVFTKETGLPCDLTPHIFRLRTQQYMFESKKFENESINAPLVRSGTALKRQNAVPTLQRCNPFPTLKLPNIEVETSPTDELSSLEIFRNKMREFLRVMQKYMKKDSDPFMKGLCDDMYITIRSTGTHHQRMCVGARENSQGSQQCYNVADFNLDFDGEYSLSRTPTNAAYQTPSALKLMRTCSAPMKRSSNFEEEEEVEA